MKLLDPHTVQDIGFLALYVSCLTALHQDDFESCLLQCMEERLPVAASAFHCNSRYLVRFQMLDKTLMISGVHPEFSDVSRDLIHCHPMGFRSNVNPCGIRMD